MSYTTTSNGIRIDDIIDNSVKVNDPSFTNQDKRDLLDAIAPNGVQLHYSNPYLKVGDRVYFDESDALFPDFKGDAKVGSLPTGYPTNPITEANLAEIRKS